MCAPPRARASLLHPSAASLMTLPTPPPPLRPCRPGKGGKQWGGEENERYKSSRDTRCRWTTTDEGWRRDRCGGCDGRLGFKWGLHVAAETPTTSRTTRGVRGQGCSHPRRAHPANKEKE
ncbi:hypothetical protein VPH35_062414 [Triticum aestivum]|uniref:Uncharacterized protein n=1 Tax=Aegilops tauschii subsp. strangulata TaxID=200361 RepID=A0A453GD30_AEGTS